MSNSGIFEYYRQLAEAAERSKPQPVPTMPQPGSMEWFEMMKNRQAAQSTE